MRYIKIRSGERLCNLCQILQSLPHLHSHLHYFFIPLWPLFNFIAWGTYLSLDLYFAWVRTLAGNFGCIMGLLPASLISYYIVSHYTPCPSFSSQHQIYAMPWAHQTWCWPWYNSQVDSSTHILSYPISLAEFFSSFNHLKCLHFKI